MDTTIPIDRMIEATAHHLPFHKKPPTFAPPLYNPTLGHFVFQGNVAAQRSQTLHNPDHLKTLISKREQQIQLLSKLRDLDAQLSDLASLSSKPVKPSLNKNK